MNYSLPVFLLMGILLLSPSLSAQAEHAKWGEVPTEDLNMTSYPLDTTAAAVVLFDVGTLEFDFTKENTKYIFERHKRIKILKRAGFNEADIALPIYKREKLYQLKAQIILPSGEKIPLDRKDFFDKELTEKISLKTFAFPNVQEGAIIEYKYTLESEYIVSLQDWFFQDDIPVRWSEYKLSIPEWFNYVILKNGRNFDLNEETSNRKNVNVNINTDRNNPANIVSVITLIHHQRLAMANVPAMKKEAYVTTYEDYYARVRFQLNRVQWPNSPAKPYMTSWEEAADELMKDVNFGLQFTKKANYSKIWQDAAPLLNPAATDAEKATLLYEFVANNMTWDETYYIYCRKSLNSCYEQKKGSAAELNLMLLALFQEAGITAHPALLSTRDHGSMFELYPFLDQFNFVIVLAEIAGKKVLFDVGSTYRPAGYPRIPALNGKAWKVDEKTPEWVEIVAPSATTTYMFRGRFNEDGELVGSFKAKFDGYDAIGHREGLHTSAHTDYWHTILAEMMPDIRVETAAIQNLDTLTAPLMVELQCNLGGVVQATGDYIYMSPILIPAFGENPFQLAERNYPVQFPHPIEHQFVLQVEIPEGYVVEELPENLNMSLPNTGGSFQLSINQTGNFLNAIYKLRINQLTFFPDEYGNLKEFYNRSLVKQTAQVILKRT